MSRTVFRSPTSVPAAAAIVPARLAERYSEVLWRDLPGGELEVAAKDGNRVERLRVHHDGSTTRAGVSTHSSALLKWPGFAAIAVLAAALVLLIGPELLGDGRWLDLAFVVIVVSAFVNRWANDLNSHLDRELHSDYDWHEPTDLHGWTPRTTAQLAAVEKLADDHGGVAYLSDLEGTTIRVRAGRHSYALDVDGQIASCERCKLFQLQRPDRLNRIEIRTWIADD